MPGCSVDAPDPQVVLTNPKELAMMKRETVLSRSLRAMFSGGIAIGLGGASQFVLAQAAPEDSLVTQRVEITGSSIKRIAAEGALPVQVLSQADIQKTGATSTTDLLQKLPALQGFVPVSSTVNGAGGEDGGGNGATTAALHALPSKYTLVLLDGVRVAPLALGKAQGGGYSVDIGAIPLDAIERVEILTDGASALYGSDAIAGVVNFITRKNSTEGNVFLTGNSPQHPGGKSWDFGVSKGFGNLDTDHFNILASYSHDVQNKLEATQRAVSARGAYFPFSAGGTNYIYDARSGNSAPVNITFNAAPTGSPAGTAVTSYSINPYYSANGNCGNSLAGVQVTSANKTSCRFNFAATVEDIPESTRDSGLLKGVFRLNEDATVWAELLLSRYDLTEAFAPAASGLAVNATTKFPSIYNTYVAPYLAAHGLTLSGTTATLGFRTVALGPREDEYLNDTSHFALGIDGEAGGWSYNGSVALSSSRVTDTLASGYGDLTEVQALVSSGAYNPVLNTGSLASSSVAGTRMAETISKLYSVHMGVQHDTFKLPGGVSILSLGADATHTSYEIDYSSLALEGSGFATEPASTDIAIGSTAGAVPFSASRDNIGAYAEWLFPITKSLEATVSDRFDSYGLVHSNDVFSPSQDPTTHLYDQLPSAALGNKNNADTYKASFRWAPRDDLLFRGAYGTGFKAPNLNDVAGPVAYSSATTGAYACPFPGSPGCQPGNSQYVLVSGGNGLSGASGLKPERSQQWTLGFRVDPVRNLSLGADLWAIRIKDQVLSAGVAEQAAFANPQQYAGLFIDPYTAPSGIQTIAFEQLPINGSVAHSKGIDWDVSYRLKTSLGNFTSSWTGTRMLRQDYQLAPGGQVYSDLGKYGVDNNVVFRTQMRVNLGLQTGSFDNSVAMNYKSGYHDESFALTGSDVYLATTTGTPGAQTAFSGLAIHSCATFDLQSKYHFNKALTLTGGIKNVFDRNPPLSLNSFGGGNQAGYDGRYYDPLGRIFYVNANYKF